MPGDVETPGGSRFEVGPAGFGAGFQSLRKRLSSDPLLLSIKWPPSSISLKRLGGLSHWGPTSPGAERQTEVGSSHH